MTSPTPSRRVLIAGSGGQLGSELCRQLGPRAVGLDLPDLDISDRASVQSAIERHPSEVLINTAAYTNVDRAESEPERCHAVNVTGVEHLAAVCRHHDVLLVQISTDYVFDGRQQTPYRETDATGPLNAYGRSKLAAERIVADLPRHLIVRTAGLFGLPGPSSSRNFVDTIRNLAQAEKPLRIVNDQHSSFTRAADLARAVLSLIEQGASGLYHVANTGSGTWYEMAQQILHLCQFNTAVAPIPMDEYPRNARRPDYSILDTSRYEQLAGHFPMPSWQSALADHIESTTQ